VIVRGLVDPKAQASAGSEVVAFNRTCGLRHVCRKGSRLTFLHRDEENSPRPHGHGEWCGNANEPVLLVEQGSAVNDRE
jgi:hypothetical protein